VSSSIPDVLVPALYAAIAPVHDLLAQRVAARARTVALRALAVADGEQVVELAPGTGLAFHRLVGANPSGWTLGIDRSRAMMRRARRRVARRPADAFCLRHGDARHLPVMSQTVDAVYAGYLLDQLSASARRQVLGEAFRALRPGGRMVLQHMTAPQTRAARGWALLARGLPVLLGGSQPTCAAAEARATGFVAVRRTYVEQAGFPSEVLYAERPALPSFP
jgi:ubiquinone/menaquinone biosynthesis C-methylase UbiE